MTDLQSSAKASVLPAGSLPKVVLGDVQMKVKILSIEPENGYDEDGNALPAENDMVKVQYPDGFIKNHQISKTDEVATLTAKIQSTLTGRYTINSFSFDTIPALTVGAEINLLEVTQ